MESAAADALADPMRPVTEPAAECAAEPADARRFEAKDAEEKDAAPGGDTTAAPGERDAPAADSAPEPSPLTEREERILAFERQWWRHAGAKEQAIRDQFGLSATRYHQILNKLLDNPAALAADPVLIKRLRRLRAARARSRGR